jgi:hypothetical protein
MLGSSDHFCEEFKVDKNSVEKFLKKIAPLAGSGTVPCQALAAERSDAGALI